MRVNGIAISGQNRRGLRNSEWGEPKIKEMNRNSFWWWLQKVLVVKDRNFGILFEKKFS